MASTRRLWTFALITSLLLLVVTAIDLARLLEGLDSSSAMVSHTYEVIGETDAVVANLRDAETNQRGYILVGDPTYKREFQHASARVARALDRLQNLVRDNPQQTARLPALRAASREKLDFAGEAIGLYDGRGVQAAEGLVRTNQGRALMQRAEQVAAVFAAEERKLLALRSAKLRAAERAAVTRAAVAGLLAVLAALFSGFLLLQRGQRTATALASTEAELAQRLAQLEAVYANAPVGLAYQDRDLRYVAINERLAQINRRSVAAHLGRTPQEVIPEVAGMVEPLIRQVLESGEPISDVELATPVGDDPEIRSFLASYWPVSDGGVLTGVNISVVAVSLKRRAREAIAEAAERYRAIVDTAVDAIVAIDANGTVQSFNPAAERIFGYAAAETVGRNIAMLMVREHAEAHDRYLSAYHESGNARIIGIGREVEGRRKDGSTFPLDLSIGEWRTTDGRRFYTGIMRDVTERKRSQEALAASEARLRAGAEVAGFGTYEWDIVADRHIWSSETYRIYGLQQDAALTLDHIVGMVHPDDRDETRIAAEAALDGTGVVDNEYRIVQPNGEVRWLAHRAQVAFEDGTRRPMRMIGAVQDITARRAAEEEVRSLNATLERRVEERTQALAEVNAELNAFAYSVSHDLRAPLRAMEGFARILLDDHAAQLDEDAQRYARRIVAAAGRMEALINDLLAYSRMSRAELRLDRLDLKLLVERAVDDVRDSLVGSDACLHVDPEIPNVIGEPSAVMQVLINLLNNAVKFRSPDRPPEVVVRAERRADRVRLTIADNGIGIAPEHRERIFRVFERLHGQESYPGTGIGLAIVRKAMERMGGSCGVDSTPGEGSRFWIELPAG